MRENAQQCETAVHKSTAKEVDPAAAEGGTRNRPLEREISRGGSGTGARDEASASVWNPNAPARTAVRERNARRAGRQRTSRRLINESLSCLVEPVAQLDGQAGPGRWRYPRWRPVEQAEGCVQHRQLVNLARSVYGLRRGTAVHRHVRPACRHWIANDPDRQLRQVHPRRSRPAGGQASVPRARKVEGETTTQTPSMV